MTHPELDPPAPGPARPAGRRRWAPMMCLLVGVVFLGATLASAATLPTSSGRALTLVAGLVVAVLVSRRVVGSTAGADAEVAARAQAAAQRRHDGYEPQHRR